MTSAVSREHFSHLVGSIYDCALDPAQWEGTLSDIQRALNSLSVVLHLNDLVENTVLFHIQAGQVIQPDEKYQAEVHGFLPRQPQLEHPFVLSRDVDPKLAAGSLMMREWLGPHGVVDIMQLFLIHSPARLSGMGVSWHASHGVATDDELALARQILPHVRRAVTISDVLELRAIHQAQLSMTLDELRCGVILTDARGVIQLANRAAEDMLREGSVVSSSSGTLRVMRETGGVELQEAIRRAGSSEADIGSVGLSVRLSDTTGTPTLAHVLPLTRGNARSVLKTNAVAAVFIGGAATETEEAKSLARLYGLTPAEQRVLTQVLGGGTMTEMARCLGLSETTVNSHLGHIFQKTQTNRRLDLVRLARSLMPPVR